MFYLYHNFTCFTIVFHKKRGSIEPLKTGDVFKIWDEKNENYEAFGVLRNLKFG